MSRTDGGSPVVEFHCSDVGVSCRNVARATSEEELLAVVRRHAGQAHDVELNDTLSDYARSHFRDARGRRSRG